MSQKLLNEALAYLGKKLDDVVSSIRATPQKIELDLGETSRKIDELKTSLQTNITQLQGAIREFTGILQQTDASRAEALEKLHSSIDAKQLDVHIDLSEQEKQAQRLLEAIDRSGAILTRIAERKHEPQTDVLLALNDIQKTIGGIRLETQEIDLSGLEKIDTSIAALLAELKRKDTGKIEGALVDLKGELGKLKLPKTYPVVLDDSQFRELSASMRYGGGGGGGAMNATHVVMANVSMTNANTEYSYAFPSNTTSFYMKLRSQDTTFQFAWASAGSGTTYMTTAQNFLQSRPGIDLTGKTIYFQSSVSAQVMEIESYVA